MELQKRDQTQNKRVSLRQSYPYTIKDSWSYLFPLSIFIAVFYTTVGCGDSKSSKNKDNIRLKRQYAEALRQNIEAVEQNDALRNKYNTLVDDYNALTKKGTGIIKQLGDTIDQSNLIVANAIDDVNAMNKALSNFTTALLEADIVNDLAHHVPDAEQHRLLELFRKGEESILQAQKSLKALSDAISLDAWNVSEAEKQAGLQKVEAAIKKLNLEGVLTEHRMLWVATAETLGIPETIGGAEGREGQPWTPWKSGPGFPETIGNAGGTAPIQLHAEEQRVAHISSGSGGGIAFDTNRKIELFETSDQFKEAALLRGGFNLVAIDHALEMAQKMKGIAGMACVGNENSDLMPVLNNIIGHMKQKANANTGDLEIGLLLDYSGSMRNNIQELIANLNSSFIPSLQNVTEAGRRVKVGVVTFNRPGNSKIAADLNSDLQEIQATLERLLAFYERDHVSIDPGEAYYLGISEAKNLVWNSPNRQIIVITDEESHLLATGQTKKVQDIQNEMAAFHVYPLIVKLCD